MTAFWRLGMYNLTLPMSSLISLVFYSNKRCLFYFKNMTQLMRTVSMALSVSVLTDFDCTFKNKRTVHYKELSLYYGPAIPHEKTRLDSTAQGFKNISIVNWKFSWYSRLNIRERAAFVLHNRVSVLSLLWCFHTEGLTYTELYNRLIFLFKKSLRW